MLLPRKTQEQLYQYLGLDRLRFKKYDITGTTPQEQIDSLIKALEGLGLVRDKRA